MKLTPYTSSTLYTPAPSYTSTKSQQGLETPNGEKIKPGDKITLYPNDMITLGANCRNFVQLVRGSTGKNEKTLGNAIARLATIRVLGYDEYVNEHYSLSLHGIEDIEKTELFEKSVVDLMNCVYICGELFDKNPQLLYTQSVPNTPLKLGSLREPSGSPAQIGLRLESGPFLAEVANQGVSLDIDTGVATVSSVGNNTFGVVYDPKNSTSYVVAYQEPVVVQPKNNSFSPFTLSGSHAVIVDAKSISSIISLASISDNATQPASSSNGMPLNQSSIEPTDNLQKLEQLKKMLDAGLITQEDYNSTKNRILSSI